MTRFLISFVIFLGLSGSTFGGPSVLTDDELDPKFWNPLLAAMKHVLEEKEVQSWEAIVQTEDKKMASSLIKHFYQGGLGTGITIDELVRKYQASVYGMLGELYATAYTRKHLLNPELIFLDGARYDELNREGCKPDGLILRKNANGSVTLEKIIESKMEGEDGFYEGQVLCTLWQWSQKGIQIEPHESINPERLNVRFNGVLYDLTSFDHCLALYLMAYDNYDAEGFLNILRRRSFLWQLVLGDLYADEVIYSESVEWSSMNAVIGVKEFAVSCANQIVDFWAGLKSAWRPQS